MKKVYAKSLLGGFIMGTIFFAIAPLGLGISLIELLKPILAPGALVTQLVFGSNAGIGQILLALTINGAIFTLFFIVYFKMKREANG